MARYGFLANLLTVEIEWSEFPLSLRIEATKRIREKLRGETEPLAQTTADATGGKRARAGDDRPGKGAVTDVRYEPLCGPSVNPPARQRSDLGADKLSRDPVIEVFSGMATFSSE